MNAGDNADLALAVMALSLVEIQDRMLAATDGPWTYSTPEVHIGHGAGAYAVGVPIEADGEFIAAAKTDVELLVAEVARLRQGIDTVRRGLRALRTGTSGVVTDTIDGLLRQMNAFM